jgi:hypothetical protein
MFVLWPFNCDPFWSCWWVPSFRGGIPPPSWYQKWLKVEMNVPPETSASPTWLQGSDNQEYHSIEFFTDCFSQLDMWWILPRRVRFIRAICCDDCHKKEARGCLLPVLLYPLNVDMRTAINQIYTLISPLTFWSRVADSFILRPSSYRAVNTFHLGYKTNHFMM